MIGATQDISAKNYRQQLLDMKELSLILANGDAVGYYGLEKNHLVQRIH